MTISPLRCSSDWKHVPVATNSMYFCVASFEIVYADVPFTVMQERPVLMLMIVPVGFFGSGWLLIQATVVL